MGVAWQGEKGGLEGVKGGVGGLWGGLGICRRELWE